VEVYKMYKILPFLITDIGEMAVIQNAVNTVVIKEVKLVEFFTKIDNESDLSFDMDLLKDYFGDRYEDVVAFLLTNKLMVENTIRKIEYEKVSVVSNDSCFMNSIKFNSEGIEEKIEFVQINKLKYDLESYDSRNLFVIFLNPFDFRMMSEIVETLREKNALMCVAFYYNHKIYVSNYYKKEWYNPCPLCFFSNLEGSLRGQSKSMNTVSFSTLLDLIYQKNPGFEVNHKFRNYEIMPLVDTIINDLKIENSRKVNSVRYIDFSRNSIMNDEALHWEVCDCYE